MHPCLKMALGISESWNVEFSFVQFLVEDFLELVFEYMDISFHVPNR